MEGQAQTAFKEPDQTSHSLKSPISHGLIFILFFIVELVLITSAVLIGIKIGKGQAGETVTGNRTAAAQNTLPSSSTPNPVPTAAEHPLLQTSSWKTYSNQELDIEFKYPASWNKEPDLDIWRVSQNNEIPPVLTLKSESANNKSVGEWIKRDQLPYLVEESFSYNQVIGLIVQDPATMGERVDIAFFPHNGKMFSLYLSSNPPQLNEPSITLMEKILSTVKFLD